MHILIGLITAIGGLAWALYRLQQAGVNVNNFNPFYWIRRRQWNRRMGVKPLHDLERPMEAAASLVVGVAKLEGDISREHKMEILNLFEQKFKLSPQHAQELFAASSYMLKDVLDLAVEVNNILTPCREKFTEETVSSLLEMLQKIAACETPVNEEQQSVIDAVKIALTIEPVADSGW